MKHTEQKMYVYLDGPGRVAPIPVGMLFSMMAKNRELFSFQYDETWLSDKESRNLDPDLHLYRGRQYPRTEISSFGLFMDSSPDRWGRMLMRRREALEARKAGRPERTLEESDYLLGVHDLARMGALRFKTENQGPFLAEDTELSTPPWVRLRELEEAAGSIEDADDPLREEEWLRILLAPGSSLGGARPKATVVDPSGHLWIAKFPSHRDKEDSGAWEKCVHELARKAGMCVPESTLERFSGHGSTFMAKRFDRSVGGSRVHFASAMTLLGKSDGASADDGTSYLELVGWIRANGCEPRKDLEELWKRIVFNITVSNTDDHLRNHGFLLHTAGWRLSPLYDVNPNPEGRGLSLNISETDNSLDFNLALSQAPRFLLDDQKARILLEQILEAVSNWQKEAALYAIPRSGISRMFKAFRLNSSIN